MEYVLYNVVGPNITSTPMNQIVVSPGNTTFTCVAEGFPRPTVEWFTTDLSGTLVELSQDDPHRPVARGGSGGSVEPPFQGAGSE